MRSDESSHPSNAVTIDNPALVFVGVPLMAGFCWCLSQWLPLLDVESRAHPNSLPLDGLRGLLAAVVFFHHSYITYVYFQSGKWKIPSSTFYGQLGPTAVTLFFFISGYLFWRKMLNDPASLRPGRLWPNRFRRIMPAYWVAVAGAFLAIAIVSKFGLRQAPQELIARSLMWLAVGIPCLPNLNGVAQERITAGVYWTLRVEVFFYLLLPALVWFRRGWRAVLVPVMALGAFLGLLHAHPESKLVECAVDTLSRFVSALLSGFSVGALAAYRINNPRIREQFGKWLRSPWAAAIGAALLCVQLGWLEGSYTWEESVLLAPIFFAVVSGNKFWGILTSRPVRCLGQISYSVYILHGLILFTLTSFLNRYQPIAGMKIMHYWAAILFMSLLTIFVCTLSYWWIERPFLQRGRGIRREGNHGVITG